MSQHVFVSFRLVVCLFIFVLGVAVRLLWSCWLVASHAFLVRCQAQEHEKAEIEEGTAVLLLFLGALPASPEGVVFRGFEKAMPKTIQTGTYKPPRFFLLRHGAQIFILLKRSDFNILGAHGSKESIWNPSESKTLKAKAPPQEQSQTMWTIQNKQMPIPRCKTKILEKTRRFAKITEKKTSPTSGAVRRCARS